MTPAAHRSPRPWLQGILVACTALAISGGCPDTTPTRDATGDAPTVSDAPVIGDMSDAADTEAADTDVAPAADGDARCGDLPPSCPSVCDGLEERCGSCPVPEECGGFCFKGGCCRCDPVGPGGSYAWNPISADCGLTCDGGAGPTP